jgi:hypothetical protein
MKDIRDYLNEAGIRIFQPYKLIAADLGGDFSKGNFPKYERQRGWIKGGTPVELSRTPWSYIAAPNITQLNIQKTLESFGRFTASTGNPFGVLDIESTGVDISKNFFHVTEVGLGVFDNIGSAKQGKMSRSLALLVSPTDTASMALNDLIIKAKNGVALTRDERFALVSLTRYSSDAKFGSGNTISALNSAYDMGWANNLKFNGRQISEMEQGLRNLQNHGVAASKVNSTLQKFVGGNMPILGFNIDQFDIPALTKLTGKKVGMFNNTVDMYNLNRIVSGSTQSFFERMNHELFGGKMPSLDFSRGEGTLTMDMFRQVFGLPEGHFSLVDIQQEGQVVGHTLGMVSDMVKESFVTSEQVASGVPLNPVTGLRYNTSPMVRGQMFLATSGLKASGLDATVDAAPTGLGYSSALQRTLYEFQGFYKDQNTFFARFFSPVTNRYSFLTGATEDELMGRIHSGKLVPVNADNLGTMPQRILEDLAERRMGRWLSIDGSDKKGYAEMRKFVRAYRDPEARAKLSSIEKRDYLAMESRLASEVDYLELFISRADKTNMNNRAKTLAFSDFYKHLDEIAPVDRSALAVGDLYAPVFGRNVSLQDVDSFRGSVYGAIDSQISNKASEVRSRDALFRNLVRSYVTEGYIDKDTAGRILNGEKLNYQIGNLHSALVGSSKVKYETALVKSLGTRQMVADAMAMAEQVATRSLTEAETVSKAFIRGAKNNSFMPGLNPAVRDRVYKSTQRIVEAYRGAGFGVELAERNGNITMFLHENTASAANTVINAIKSGSIPTDAAMVSLPSLDNMGNIILGGQRRVRIGGILKPGGVVADPFDELKPLSSDLGVLRRQLQELRKCFGTGCDQALRTIFAGAE